MKISAYAHFVNLIDHLGIEAAADFVLAHGCEAVEFIDIFGTPSFVKDEETAKEFKRVLDSKGLTVSCYSVALNLCKPEDPSYDSSEAMAFLRHGADMAKILGSPFLHHTLVLDLKYHPDEYVADFEKVMEKLVPLACEIADICEEHGLITLYEPQGLYANGKENFSKFYYKMKALGKRVGVCGDMGNTFFCDWSAKDFFDEFATEMLHLHAKDYKLICPAEITPEMHVYTSIGGQLLTPTPLGDGDSDVKYCLDKARALGYDGTVSLEGHYVNLEKEMAYDVEFLKNYFDNI